MSNDNWLERLLRDIEGKGEESLFREECEKLVDGYTEWDFFTEQLGDSPKDDSYFEGFYKLLRELEERLFKTFY